MIRVEVKNREYREDGFFINGVRFTDGSKWKVVAISRWLTVAGSGTLGYLQGLTLVFYNFTDVGPQFDVPGKQQCRSARELEQAEAVLEQVA